MMDDIMTVTWKELKEYLLLGGAGRRGPGILLLLVSLTGVFLPWRIGPAWLTSPAPLVAALYLSLTVVVNVIGDSFAGERERHTLETLLASRLPDAALVIGKTVAAIVYSFVVTMFSLILALPSANFAGLADGPRFYDPPIFLGAAVLSLVASGLWTTLGVLTSIDAATVRQAQQRMSVAIILVFAVPAFGFRLLPESQRGPVAHLVSTDPSSFVPVVCLALLLFGAAMLALCLRRFQRDRLIA